MTEEEDTCDTEKMDQALNQLRRDRVEDLATTAGLISSWMSDQKYTIAEQLAVTELLRSSLLVNYIQMQQMEGMAKFMKEHPNAQIVVVDGRKKAAPDHPEMSDPTRN